MPSPGEPSRLVGNPHPGWTVEAYVHASAESPVNTRGVRVCF